MVKNNLKNTTSGKKIDFPIPVSSYKMILIGFGIIILGFILMMGGGSDNPAEFNYDIFSFRSDHAGSDCGVDGFWICFLGDYAEA